jgi:RNA polymerase sigma-70 factor, ECF subfamily
MAIERDALVQILLRERVRLTASAAAIARDVHAADDIFQQVVVAALQVAGSFRDGRHVLAWAVRTARHRALDLVERRKLVPLPDDVLDQLEADWADPTGDTGSDQVEALHRCLGRVAGPAREVLRLRYVDGMTAVAIADRLRRTADAIYQMLSRTHRALRRCVELEMGRVGQPAEGGVS